MAEPQWFFSSLAQVTAALAGFIGGFLLLRLLEVIKDWHALLETLKARQARWSRAEYEERLYDQVHEVKVGPYTGERLRLNNQESAAWEELYQTIQEQSQVRMPRELLSSLSVVMGSPSVLARSYGSRTPVCAKESFGWGRFACC